MLGEAEAAYEERLRKAARLKAAMRSGRTGPSLKVREISLKFGPVFKRLRSFSWTVFFCKSSWHVCLTQMQHSLWSHIMHANNECAYNMNPVNARV